jgi:catechol 2,3-dioxygenase-like lactoylglutathione lyase family enzyme
MQPFIRGVDHVGVRVSNEDRSVAFYRKLGFEVTWRGAEGVVILRNPAGVEVNLIVNAEPSLEGNVLMDVTPKRAGWTHVALSIASIEDGQRVLAELGIPLSGSPTRLGAGVSMFIRDPDGNVIELRERQP